MTVKNKGYTTGSCCAAGAAAALTFILANEKKDRYNMVGPTGLDISVPIKSVDLESERAATCVVVKDGGDDPDVTTGSDVSVKVELVKEHRLSEKGYRLNEQVYLESGVGVGVIHKPGLACPVGKAAINPVPRKMILNEVMKVCDRYSYHGKVVVKVEIPSGEMLAGKTFNPKLGIVGGISVLGTTGVVEPMSSRAIVDTIKTELSVAKAMRERNLSSSEDRNKILITPGNYGLDFLGSNSLFEDFPAENIMKVSNFIGESVKLAAEAGFTNIIVSGHLGKIIKVAGGMLNTHSKYGDNRVETAMVILKEILQGESEIEHCGDKNILGESETEHGSDFYGNLEKELDEVSIKERWKCLEEQVFQAVMVDEIIRLVLEFGGKKLVERFSREVCRKARNVLVENVSKSFEKCDKIKVKVIVFTNKYGLLYSEV